MYVLYVCMYVCTACMYVLYVCMYVCMDHIIHSECERREGELHRVWLISFLPVSCASPAGGAAGHVAPVPAQYSPPEPGHHLRPACGATHSPPATRNQTSHARYAPPSLRYRCLSSYCYYDLRGLTNPPHCPPPLPRPVRWSTPGHAGLHVRWWATPVRPAHGPPRLPGGSPEAAAAAHGRPAPGSVPGRALLKPPPTTPQPHALLLLLLHSHL